MCEVARASSPSPIVSLNRRLAQCKDEHRWPEALALLRQSRRTGLEPTIVTYGAAATAAERPRCWQRTLDLLEEAKDQKLQLNVVTAGVAISACEAESGWQQVIHLLEGGEASGLEGSLVAYNASISVCDKAGAWADAVGLLSTACARTLKADRITFTSAHGSAGRRQNPGPTEAPPPSHTRLFYVALSFAAARACEAGSAWRPTLQILGSILDELAAFWLQWASVPAALFLLGHMASQQLPRDTAAYNSVLSPGRMGAHVEAKGNLIGAFHKLCHQRLRCGMEAPASRVEPNAITYGTAMSACDRSLEWRQSLQLLEDAQNSSLELDVVMLNAAISSWSVVFEPKEGVVVATGSAAARGSETKGHAAKPDHLPCDAELLRNSDTE
ncbi:unnamed protein product [Symbiodinium natans]|uniref:Pentatricopeptide repeat-containing protein, chloroplastic n=1 Tax=Symbiodinium natans TaxID=878477 RepID=A0A812SQ19_9DINO|nr:unnamed protein product [Symbiodinium natans]